MFALADVNSFYASCEELFKPSIKGMPIIVLSNNDGACVARSAAAKKLGIKMGEPLFKIKHLIRRHNVQVFSSNYALYADLSARIMTILEDMAPAVEIYSIDEAFMLLKNMENIIDYEQFGREVRARVLKWTGLCDRFC